MMTQKEMTAETVISKIEEARGNISVAAKLLKTSRQTLYKYIGSHPTVKDALDTSRESMIDNVESVLYSKALEGEAWAVCFFLKTQGKHRGYVERWENTGKDGGPIETKDVTLSDDERVERIASLLDTARARQAGQVANDPAGEVQE